jgi:hypothetical protein
MAQRSVTRLFGFEPNQRRIWTSEFHVPDGEAHPPTNRPCGSRPSSYSPNLRNDGVAELRFPAAATLGANAGMIGAADLAHQTTPAR